MGVRRLYKVTSPYVHTAVKELDYSQTADVQYLVHRGYDPFKLERSSHTDSQIGSSDSSAPTASSS